MHSLYMYIVITLYTLYVHTCTIYIHTYITIHIYTIHTYMQAHTTFANIIKVYINPHITLPTRT